VRLSESPFFVVKEGVEQPDGDNSVRLFFYVLYRDGLHPTLMYYTLSGLSLLYNLNLNPKSEPK
jgi:hypothetical protein